MTDTNMPHVNYAGTQDIASLLKVLSIILGLRQFLENSNLLVFHYLERFWMSIEDSPSLTYGKAFIQFFWFVPCLV